jgi:hypothetical protein
VRRTPPDAGQSQHVRNQGQDGSDYESRQQERADVECGLVEFPAADKAHRRRHPEHCQHSEEEAKCADRVASGQSLVLAVQSSGGFRAAEAGKQERFCKRMCSCVQLRAPDDPENRMRK